MLILSLCSFTHSLDKAGCPQWTRASLKFIGDIIPERVISENERWWTNDYVVGRLIERFDDRTVKAVIALARRDYRRQAEKAEITEIEVVELMTGLPSSKIYRRQRQMMRAVKQDYRMPNAYF